MRVWMLCVAIAIVSAGKPTEDTVIEHVKNVDVHRLDPTLKSETLAGFVARTVPAHCPQKWSVSTCDLKPDKFPPPADHPLCGDLVVMTRDEYFKIVVRVGSYGSGIEGEPKLISAFVNRHIGGGSFKAENFKRLSDATGAFSGPGSHCGK